MNEHQKIIEQAIKDSFSLRENFLNYRANTEFQLSLSQLDFFKTISALVVGIVGIGYFYCLNLDKSFLVASFLLALITLIFVTSYIREKIDLQGKTNKKIGEFIESKTIDTIKKAIESKKKEDINIFINYSKEQLKTKIPELTLEYAGETIVFLFYLSLGFLVLSFFSFEYDFKLISLQTIILIITSYFLSFKDWSTKISIFFSKDIRNLYIKKS